MSNFVLDIQSIHVYITHLSVYSVGRWHGGIYTVEGSVLIIFKVGPLLGSYVFIPPRSKIEGAYSFCPVCHSVILSFCPPLWNFSLANNFWTVSATAFIFHMSIPCDKTFSWVPLFLTLWPGPWSLTNFLKTLALLITFEQWVLELWYFTWIFPVIRPFRGYHYFLNCDLGVWPIFF